MRQVAERNALTLTHLQRRGFGSTFAAAHNSNMSRGITPQNHKENNGNLQTTTSQFRFGNSYLLSNNQPNSDLPSNFGNPLNSQANDGIFGIQSINRSKGLHLCYGNLNHANPILSYQRQSNSGNASSFTGATAAGNASPRLLQTQQHQARPNINYSDGVSTRVMPQPEDLDNVRTRDVNNGMGGDDLINLYWSSNKINVQNTASSMGLCNSGFGKFNTGSTLGFDQRNSSNHFPSTFAGVSEQEEISSRRQRLPNQVMLNDINDGGQVMNCNAGPFGDNIVAYSPQPHGEYNNSRALSEGSKAHFANQVRRYISL